MKKLTSLLLCLMLLLSVCTGALAADGTFQGEGAGKGGMINVEVTVENGEIAAVLIDEEATLKRVYISGNTLTLVACNSKYQPLVYTGEQLNQIHILGKAVGFTSTIN